jgi:hypothetical protein
MAKLAVKSPTSASLEVNYRPSKTSIGSPSGLADLEGLEMTLEILGDTNTVARISESLAALGRGEPGADLATVRQDLARRRATGT